MKNKWAVVDVRSSRGIKSCRKIVAKFNNLKECEYFISETKANNKRSYPTELAIREVK